MKNTGFVIRIDGFERYVISRKSICLFRVRDGPLCITTITIKYLCFAVLKFAKQKLNYWR